MRRAGVGGNESGMGAADLAAAAGDWSGMGSQTLPASGGGEELGEEVEMMMGGWVGGREGGEAQALGWGTSAAGCTKARARAPSAPHPTRRTQPD
jgi:hypothetical protein